MDGTCLGPLIQERALHARVLSQSQFRAGHDAVITPNLCPWVGRRCQLDSRGLSIEPNKSRSCGASCSGQCQICGGCRALQKKVSPRRHCILCTRVQRGGWPPGHVRRMTAPIPAETRISRRRSHRCQRHRSSWRAGRHGAEPRSILLDFANATTKHVAGRRDPALKRVGQVCNSPAAFLQSTRQD